MINKEPIEIKLPPMATEWSPKMATQQVKRWGNSLAVRIPAGLADTLRLQEDTDVEVSAQDGALVIKPAGVKKFSMARFLEEGPARRRARQEEPLLDDEPMGSEAGGPDDPARNDVW
jgi:antitoxin MazE